MSRSSYWGTAKDSAMGKDVYLSKLSGTEFIDYRRLVIREYAEESAAAGRIAHDGALEWAAKETDRLLPNGNDTKDAYLFKIMSHSLPGLVLGYLWSARDHNNPGNAFIFDVQVFPAYRGKGIGTAALRQLDVFLKELRYRAVGLHVYATNEQALALYSKCGYRPISHVLRKEL